MHVLDASRAVPVASSLIKRNKNQSSRRKCVRNMTQLRTHTPGQRAKLCRTDEARAKAPQLKFDDLPAPEFTGARTIAPSLEELTRFIDWSPFFHTWELRGVYPKICSMRSTAKRPANCSPTPKHCWQKSLRKNCSSPRGVYGFFPANRAGDDVRVVHGSVALEWTGNIPFFAAANGEGERTPNWCLADFVAPRAA